MTAQELGDEVLKLVNVVASVDTPNATQRATVLAILNAMLDSFNAEGLLVPYQDIVTHTLTIDDHDYTIGPSGNIVATRPIDIKQAFIREDDLDTEIDVIDYADYEAIEDKLGISGRPTKLAYKKTPTNGTIYLWKKPSEAFQLRVLVDVMFAQVIAATSIDNNPGYLEMFKYNLAIRVATHYQRDLDRSIVVLGNDLLRSIRRRSLGDEPIAQVATGVLGSSNTGGYDIRRGV